MANLSRFRKRAAPWLLDWLDGLSGTQLIDLEKALSDEEEEAYLRGVAEEKLEEARCLVDAFVKSMEDVLP